MFWLYVECMKAFFFHFWCENHVYGFLARKPLGGVLELSGDTCRLNQFSGFGYEPPDSRYEPPSDANWVWTVLCFLGSRGTFGTSREIIYFVECLMLYIISMNVTILMIFWWIEESDYMSCDLIPIMCCYHNQFLPYIVHYN